MSQSLYVHIPFCLKRCIYCDFVSGIYDPQKEAAYIDALKKEICAISNKTLFSTLFIGGGTPTVLSVATLTGLITHIFEHFNFIDDYEATIEANPGTLDKEKSLAINASGINRISIGVQSFNDDELRFLGRQHSSDDAEKGVLIARESGFRNIGVDLIYGIPGQDISKWKNTLEMTVRLSPEHISAYELTVEKGTVLHDYLNKSNVVHPHPDPPPSRGRGSLFDVSPVSFPSLGGRGVGGGGNRFIILDEDQIIEMYEYAIDYLKTEGYIHYEITNFSTPGFSCRHNINYWDSGDYYGVGLGAHSHLNRRRFNNTENLEEYINLLSHGVNSVKNEEEITPEKALSEVFFLGLRKTDGVEMKKLSKALGRDVSVVFGKEIAELEEAGLMEVYDKGSRIRLTRKGLCLSNEVFIKFI